jgi:hypothetical protein
VDAVIALVAQARAAGLALRADEGRLMVRGPRSAERIVAQLREHKPAILALLAHEKAEEEAQVAWCVAVLRPHVSREGPIVLPSVRAGVPSLVDPKTGEYGAHCGSCGEPREAGQRFHCRACQRARYVVLLEMREGVRMGGVAPDRDGGRGGALGRDEERERGAA